MALKNEKSDMPNESELSVGVYESPLDRPLCHSLSILECVCVCVFVCLCMCDREDVCECCVCGVCVCGVFVCCVCGVCVTV